MIGKSPSGALSPYYYKGGYFHGIHYGSYFDDAHARFSMRRREEGLILRSPKRRRILMYFYETYLTKAVLDELAGHIERLRPRIVKLAIAADQMSLRQIRRALRRADVIEPGCCYLCTDMEEGKTWLVSDRFA